VNLEKETFGAVDKVLNKHQQINLENERRVDGRKLDETRP